MSHTESSTVPPALLPAAGERVVFERNINRCSGEGTVRR